MFNIALYSTAVLGSQTPSFLFLLRIKLQPPVERVLRCMSPFKGALPCIMSWRGILEICLFQTNTVVIQSYILALGLSPPLCDYPVSQHYSQMQIGLLLGCISCMCFRHNFLLLLFCSSYYFSISLNIFICCCLHSVFIVHMGSYTFLLLF